MSGFDRRTCRRCGPESLHYFGQCTHCVKNLSRPAAQPVVYVRKRRPLRRTVVHSDERRQIRAELAQGASPTSVANRHGLSRSAIWQISKERA